jgi:PAS domain S-box-containing protein
VVAKLGGWTKQLAERTSLLRRLNIGPRLTGCFVFIILAMLVGNAVLLWQFQRIRAQAERLSGIDQELIVVLQAHTTLMSFYEQLDTLAHSENTAALVTEAESLRNALLEDGRRTRQALSHLSPEVQLDPSLLPTLEAVQDTLPAELADITELAKSKDWQAVRLRLANQVRPLEVRTSELVQNIDREVGEKRAQALLEIGEAQRRIFLFLSLTAVFMLLFAALLGVSITRSITRPLEQLVEGTQALAGGDFSHRVPASGKDEIALLGNVFNDMVERLQELYRELQRREAYLTKAQKLSHTGSFGWDLSGGAVYWSPETFRIFEYDLATQVSLDHAVQRTHPEDRDAFRRLLERVSREKTEFDFEHRLLLPDGSIKYLRVVGHPSDDAHGHFEFVGAVTDITDSKLAQEALMAQKAQLDELLVQAPEGIVLLDVQDRVMRINPEFTGIFGYTSEEAIGRQINDLIAPEELRGEAEEYTQRMMQGSRIDAETIRRAKDGRRVHVSLLAVPISVPGGQIAEFAIYRDLTQHKRVEGELTKQRAHLEQLFETVPEALALVDLNDIILRVNPEFTRIFGYTPEEAVGRPINDLIAPGELRAEANEFSKRVTGQGETLNVETIRGRKDGSRFPVSIVSVPISIGGSQIAEYAIYRDITQRKRAEEALRRSEAYLAEAQRLSLTGSFGWDVATGSIYWSQETFRIFECDPSVAVNIDFVAQRTHPEDLPILQGVIDRALRDKAPFDFEHRLLFPDASVKSVRVIGRLSVSESGRVEFLGAITDITERKRRETLLRESEQRFRAIFDSAGTGIAVVDMTAGWHIENNRALQNMLGSSQEELSRIGTFDELTIEENREADALAFRELCEGRCESLRQEKHLIRRDGRAVWANVIFTLLRDADGRPSRVIAIHEDITERKRAESELRQAFDEIKKLQDQLFHENIALREEIDRSSMFEEIVGESPALQTVLARVAKVAPTDSTVLITGETGTGKELIARAIHKRSQRAAGAFVSVNCAVIPPSLIASELFGHEKGAFTGALQRRLGRFEMAEGGTIFIDEIGELPPETQVALLRVLQEREFDRLGGTKTIRSNVRVIAATNRNLQAAADAGTFRSDLYYRLNVFPIEMPPLRERIEDIPLLVEYFIDRYASKAGKKIRGISRVTLDRLKAYPWPGNIRELQNVIERSVIVCETENFTVDESWLSRTERTVPEQSTFALFKLSASEEKKVIEAALAEAHGRVSGPTGAAAKLGVPPSTLDSKIKALNINKHRFKTA